MLLEPLADCLVLVALPITCGDRVSHHLMSDGAEEGGGNPIRAGHPHPAADCLASWRSKRRDELTERRISTGERPERAVGQRKEGKGGRGPRAAGRGGGGQKKAQGPVRLEDEERRRCSLIS
eukprot:scaffold144883_cov29-Tisochrysis_lutea.AAC.3